MQFKSEADVKRLSLSGKTDAIFVDDTLPGFGFRIRKLSTGETRKFVYQYRFGGRTWRLDIGDWPGMSVKAARDRAEAYRGQLKDAKLGKGPASRSRARCDQDRGTPEATVQEPGQACG